MKSKESYLDVLHARVGREEVEQLVDGAGPRQVLAVDHLGLARLEDQKKEHALGSEGPSKRKEFPCNLSVFFRLFG